MNGTFVNGERLETGVPAEVNDGDQVRVGLVELTLRLGG
jgi:pSer/pThr/pTyr-binding forkhead associated (FHA) protein